VSARTEYARLVVAFTNYWSLGLTIVRNDSGSFDP
jgi:hypothetical protein